MSPITQGELLFGIEKIRETTGFAAAMRAFADLLQLIPVATIDGAIAAPYARFRARRDRSGFPIGNNDLWIAAHAASLDMTLVTNNTREFDRLMPDLRVENWADGPA